MKHKGAFVTALLTLIASWGGDTPSEAIWTLNELLDWYEAEYDIKLHVRYGPPPCMGGGPNPDSEFTYDFELIEKAIYLG